MPDWFAVTGAITNVATAIDMGYRYRPTEIIYGKDAGDILKQVDEILKHSKDVLENHKGLLEDELYEDLCQKHRVYHWQMADESQGHRATRDEIIRNSRILSQLFASEGSRQKRAETLLATVEQYQTDVLSASQTAHQNCKGQPIALFPDVKNESVEITPSPTKSFTSWVFSSSNRKPQVDIESATSSSDSAPPSSSIPSTAGTLVDDQPYIVAVTHIPEDESQSPTGTDTASYRRAISIESGSTRINVIDTRSHLLSKDETFIDENSLHAMSLLAARVLNERNNGVPAGTQTTTEDPSISLESTIKSFKQLST